MKDEYVSVEHVFLGLLDEPTQNTTELFRAFNIKKDAFLQQLFHMDEVKEVES